MWIGSDSAGIYLFKINMAMYEVCTKLTVKTSERGH